MAKNHTFLKVKLGEEDEAYTTLTGALKSESLIHLYSTARYVILKNDHFRFGEITIKKIKLTHQKHKK